MKRSVVVCIWLPENCFRRWKRLLTQCEELLSRYLYRHSRHFEAILSRRKPLEIIFGKIACQLRIFELLSEYGSPMSGKDIAAAIKLETPVLGMVQIHPNMPMMLSLYGERKCSSYQKESCGTQLR